MNISLRVIINLLHLGVYVNNWCGMAANNVCQLNLSLRRNLPISIWHAVSWHPPVTAPSGSATLLLAAPANSRAWHVCKGLVICTTWDPLPAAFVPELSIELAELWLFLLSLSSFSLSLPTHSYPSPFYISQGHSHESLVLPNSAWYLLLSRSKFSQLMLRVV